MPPFRPTVPVADEDLIAQKPRPGTLQSAVCSCSRRCRRSQVNGPFPTCLPRLRVGPFLISELPALPPERDDGDSELIRPAVCSDDMNIVLSGGGCRPAGTLGLFRDCWEDRPPGLTGEQVLRAALGRVVGSSFRKATVRHGSKVRRPRHREAGCTGYGWRGHPRRSD